MKTSLLIAGVTLMAASVFHSANAGAATEADGRPLSVLAQEALSKDTAQSMTAIEQLRAIGPAGLDAMFQLYGERIQRRQNNPTAKDADWEQLRTALDTIGQQRDDYASHLYWFTDLEKAKAAARASGKPILSLRLLGKLNEEYSCANSRFFRTTLYPNTEVSQYLRGHFILHWQSVRPVPRITIDMGDGRRIERTITGNSIHYILDADGNPIDALPGLYGAKAFLAELDRAADAERRMATLRGADRENFLVSYHSNRLVEIQREWSSDLAKISQLTGAAPMLRSGAESDSALDRNRLETLSTDAVWQKIAALHSGESPLDSSSVRLIQFKQAPTAAEAARITFSKTVVENPMVRMLWNLQRSIAEDTVHDEYQLHARIHEWFANGTVPANLEVLNSKIYAELFLTPNSDAWLGLAPNDVFSALDGGGLVKTP